MKARRIATGGDVVTDKDVEIGSIGDTVLEDAVWTLFEVQEELPRLKSVVLVRDDGVSVEYRKAE